MKNFKWVKGNTLPIAVPLYEVLYTEGQQPTKSEYFPPEGSVVKAFLVGAYKRVVVPCQVDGNVVTFVDDGALSIGTYGIEITVAESARNLRTFKCGQVTIVKCSDEMELGELPVVDGTIQLDGEPFYWAKGDAATIEVGTTTTGQPNTPASVINVGDEHNAVFNFIIPKGEKGEDGIIGKDGITPHIDDTTGNWFLGDEDTGVHAQGPKGEDAHVTRDSIEDALDASEGKNLSTEDYTTAEKEKLGVIESGAQVNIIEAVKINGVAQTISEKAVELPPYPTSLPASDVYTWAKQPTKPSYSYSEITNKPSFATVATSGSYDDLLDKPTIPDAQIQSDWNQTDDTAKDYIKNKPTSLPASDVHAWAKTENKPSYTLDEVSDGSTRKLPTKVSDLTNDAGYTTNVGTVTGVTVGSTAYTPSSGVVTIPAYPTTLPASDVYDWAKAASKPTYAYSEITDKPTFATVATSGSYADLSNKPSIPTALSDLSDDSTHRLVTDTKIGNWDDVYGVVPSAAYNIGNELADKAFVNSSIATATADYQGNYNLVNDLSLTTAATHSDIQTALTSKISGADNNDYCFVEIPTADATPTQIARVERYKYNGTSWAYEYTLNNSSFTANQWAAINSGITASLVTAFGNKYDKPSGGIPDTDLSSAVQTSLGKADTALQSHQSVVDSDATLAWATKTKIGSVGSTDIHVTLPSNPNTDTHRPIQVGGTQILGDNTTALNLVAGTNISLSNDDGAVTISSTGGSANMDTASISGTTLSAQVNTYYTASDVVNTLAVTLPAISDATKTQSIVLHFTAGTTPNITFTSADSKTISFYNGYEITSGLEYELNIVFDGTKWIVAFGVIGGTYEPIPVASSSTLGGIKVGYSTSGQNYGIALDSNNKAYVNVPWTDTKNTAGSTNNASTKMYIVGTTSQAANPQTYSNVNCYIGSDNCLYSNGNKVFTGYSETIDLSQYTAQKCALGGSAWYNTNNDTCRHKAIPVSAGDELTLSVTDSGTSGGGWYVFVTSSYNPPYSSGGTVPSTSSTVRFLVETGATATVTAPSNAAYLILTTVDGASQSITWGVSKYQTINANFIQKVDELETMVKSPTSRIPMVSYNSMTYKGAIVDVAPHTISSQTLGSLTTVSDSVQGFAVFGDYLFQCHDKMASVVVFKLSTGQSIQTISLTANNNNHANSASFGSQYYNSSDPFPCLYVSSEDESKVYVYRITGTEGSFSMTLVQTLSYSVSPYYYPNMHIDADNNRGVVECYTGSNWQSATNNEMVCMCFELPAPTAGNTTLTSPYNEYHFPFVYSTQGGFARYGKLYIAFGNTSAGLNIGGILVIDYIYHNIDTFIDLKAVGNLEPEGVGIYGNNLVITTQNRDVIQIGINTASGVSSLSSLTDVSLSNITNGQALVYNSSSQKWENQNVSGGGGSSMDSTTFSGTTLTAAVGTYYRASSAVGTLAVTLPSVSGTEVKSIILHFTTSSSPSITFTSADSKTISYYANYAIAANKEYEVNVIYNGAKWIIASAEITTA